MQENNKAQDEDHFFWWFIGILLLTFALLLSARMGIFQESIAQRYGKHPRETLYYTVITLILVVT